MRVFECGLGLGPAFGGVRRRARAAALALPLLAAGAVTVAAMGAATGAAAQDVRTAVVGDTIRVGDVVAVAVRVTVDRGERVAWPDTLPLAGEMVENAARVRTRVDTLADGRLQATGVYAVTPWQTGEVPLPEVAVQVVAEDEAVRTLTAGLPALDVVSVLPEDTAGLEPQPAKGVLGRSWSLWPILLALLALAALVAALLWWRGRRGRTGAVPLEPPVSPRERVLARLQEARQAGLLERGDMKAFYTRVSDAVREYLAALEPAWGEDLTTTELVARFRAQIGPGPATSLGAILRPADQVKFARRRPDVDSAVAEWQATRQWVLGFQWPPRAAADEHGEAA